MRRNIRFVSFAVPLVLAAMTIGAGAASLRQPHTGGGPREAFEVREKRRVQAHFDSVLRELRTSVPTRLTSTQAAGREQLIATLQGYRDRAQFPRNYDFDEQTPYFVDRKTGTRCAVAHLLESTKRHDLVARVASTNNNVRAGDLYADTAFVSWLDQHGLTIADAARIQPAYEGDPRGPGEFGVIGYVAVGAALTTVASSVGLTVWNVTGNVSGKHKKAGVWGLVTGLGTTMLGGTIAAQGTQPNEQRFGQTVAVTGVVGMIAAANALSNRNTRRRATGDSTQAASRTSANSARGGISAAISPVVPLSRTGGAGVVVSLRF
ncbi:MAG: hypothetical protein IT353_17270 [Gemmatimonadaceae bacterium]|nr:hypothetical protein [Gemmatimonadaceae bacterium]